MPIATDTLSLVFIACFLFGLLFLVASLLLGFIGDFGHGVFEHLHIGGDTHSPQIHAGHTTHTHVGHDAHASHAGEHGHSGHGSHSHSAEHESRFSIFSILNPTSIVFFLLGFGFFGYVFHNNLGAGLPLALTLAIVSGAIISGLLVLLINRIIGSGRTHTELDVSDRVGLVGKVILTIRENSIGEMLYETPGGLRKSIPARSVDGHRIERGEEVVVVTYKGGVADVDTWEHFIQQDEVNTGSSSAALDDASLEELRAFLAKAEKPDNTYATRKEQSKDQ